MFDHRCLYESVLIYTCAALMGHQKVRDLFKDSALNESSPTRFDEDIIHGNSFWNMYSL